MALPHKLHFPKSKLAKHRSKWRIAITYDRYRKSYPKLTSSPVPIRDNDRLWEEFYNFGKLLGISDERSRVTANRIVDKSKHIEKFLGFDLLE